MIPAFPSLSEAGITHARGAETVAMNFIPLINSACSVAEIQLFNQAKQAGLVFT